jgi:hypothetical protein
MTPDCDVTTFETWRLKAEEDFTAASILARHGGPAATICFLCRQAFEVRPEEAAGDLTAAMHLGGSMRARSSAL